MHSVHSPQPPLLQAAEFGFLMPAAQIGSLVPGPHLSLVVFPPPPPPPQPVLPGGWQGRPPPFIQQQVLPHHGGYPMPPPPGPPGRGQVGQVGLSEDTLCGPRLRRLSLTISIIPFHSIMKKVLDSKSLMSSWVRIQQNCHLLSPSVRIGLWPSHANFRPSVTEFSLLLCISGISPTSGGCRSSLKPHNRCCWTTGRPSPMNYSRCSAISTCRRHRKMLSSI
jgi:hypothetical protein